MIKISAGKIRDIAADIDGKTIDGIRFTQSGEPQGIMATFTVDASDEGSAQAAVKKYLKEKYPVLRIYVEIV